MSKISQEAARNISRKIVQKIQDQITATEKQIQEYIRPLYEATIPVEIMKMYKKHPKYMRGCSSVYISGPGLERTYTSIGEPLPSYVVRHLSYNKE